MFCWLLQKSLRSAGEQLRQFFCSATEHKKRQVRLLRVDVYKALADSQLEKMIPAVRAGINDCVGDGLDRNVRRDFDIALDRMRVGAHNVALCGQVFCRGFGHAGKIYIESDFKAEAFAIVSCTDAGV